MEKGSEGGGVEFFLLGLKIDGAKRKKPAGLMKGVDAFFGGQIQSGDAEVAQGRRGGAFASKVGEELDELIAPGGILSVHCTVTIRGRSLEILAGSVRGARKIESIPEQGTESRVY